MTLLYVPIAVAALACFLYSYFTRHFNHWKNKGVAGPTPVPFFGNLKESTMRRKYIGEVMKDIYFEYPNEKIVGIYRMTTPCLLVRDLDIIKEIMIKDFDLFVDRGMELSKDGLGMNLFHADEETWRVLRNRFTPVFTTGKLKNMMYLLEDRGDRLLKYIDSLCAGQNKTELLVSKIVQKYTMSAISACAFGLDIDTFYNDIPELKKVDEMTFQISYAQELDMMYPGLLKKINISFFPKFVSDYFDSLVKSIIQQRNSEASNRHDFMDLILELRNQKQITRSKKTSEEERMILEMSDDVISAQAFVFFAAGYETSATTLSSFFYEMAKNPEIQEKIIAEVKRVLQKHDTVTYDVLTELEYTSRALDETLRKYPIVDPQRNVKVDYPIPGTNVVLKKGTTVIVSAIAIHNDPQHYPEPEKFDPDRFTPENAAARHSCAYLPFGVGPRNCIGMRFAKVQSLMCIAKFYSRFKVELSPNTSDIKLDPGKRIAGPVDGIKLNIVKQ